MNNLSNNYKGFYNLGNTCYLNSGLQLIMNNKELCQSILALSKNNSNNTDSNNTDSNNKDSNFIVQFSQFIKDYYNNTNNNTTLDPGFIKQLVANKSTEFTGYKQSDSFEFIIYLLDFIFENLKIKKLYQSTLNIKIKCKLLSCLNISQHNENNNYLLLDILNGFKDLDDCYRNYKQREKLVDENSYFCENCKDKRIASKRNEIIHWPDHLIIVLKRFTNEGRPQKNNNKIDVPLLWRHGYKLKGIVFHSGSLFGGHYIYIGNHNNKWNIFNDDHVTEISEGQLDNYKNTGYIYYFQKSN
jgi:ubiquitin C-terminal hydrolase